MINQMDIPDNTDVMASAIDHKQIDIHWRHGKAIIEFEFEYNACPADVWIYLSMLHDSMEMVLREKTRK